MSTKKRQINDEEKQEVLKLQKESDGSIRCFISGEVIDLNNLDSFEYDHIIPFAKEGSSDINNIRVVLKKYNRRKSDQSLYEIRDNLRLERLFNDKSNFVKLQDVLELKEIEPRPFQLISDSGKIKLADGTDTIECIILNDPILKVDYFYGRVPLKWIQNDDQEGLQPRVIDYKRLISLRDHLNIHPQLAPAIARLIGNRIYLFDGQHKTAAQIVNGVKEIDVKVYLVPESPQQSKQLFDSLMITNLEAHSKLRQVPFYTSTLLERLSVIYQELWEEFATSKPQASHSEANFVNFLVTEKNFDRKKAKEIFKAAIKENVLSKSKISKYIAEASKDLNYPITQDLLKESIFPNCLYLEPSIAQFDTTSDFRNSELENFHTLSDALIDKGYLEKWVPAHKNSNLSDLQLKARRIWHKGSVMTWGPYLQDIIINVFNIQTGPEREKLLYRPKINTDQIERLNVCLERIFNHPLWDSPKGQIDALLTSAKNQDQLFEQQKLTRTFVLTGIS